MKVLFTVSEAAPFVTTGGLGEIGGSLPKALCQRGMDVRVALPKYSAIAQSLLEEADLVCEMKVTLAWRSQYCGVLSLTREGVTYYFFENDYYFHRNGLYGFYDEAERYAFFCRAVLDALPVLGFQPDVIHCHDWQTALIPILLNKDYQYDPFYAEVKTVFTIHNVKYQGRFPWSVMGDVVGVSVDQDLWEKVEFHETVNWMKGAIYYAGRVTTVSPTYAQEILDPYFGEGLDGVLRDNEDKLSGILNGIDGSLYNPETDPHIFKRFDSSLAQKEENKTRLEALLGMSDGGLPAQGTGGQIPLLGMVTRFADQKGLDLVRHVFEEIMCEDVHMVMLGSGEWEYEHFFSTMAARYPGKFAVYVGYDAPLAHRIYAASDMLLMPSRFEPCGIAQMIAMRYGTIPIVRETGGLKDTVCPFNEHTDEGNGFGFANYNAHEMLEAIRRAVQVYRQDERAWRRLFKNARQADVLWDTSAGKYAELYEEVRG